MMHQNVGETSLDPEKQLAGDWAMFQAVETAAADTVCRTWQASRPVVVLGRHGRLADEVIEEHCWADEVRVLRRESGGGAVVLGPGCLNYAVVLALDRHPQLADIAESFAVILRTAIRALEVPGLSIDGGTDLVLRGRKVSGNAQRRGRRALLHHGTLLYDFDSALASRYLKEPVRRPAYRSDRRHGEFIGNLPLSAEALRVRLKAAWRAFGHRDGPASDEPENLRQETREPGGRGRTD
jgi:lipoate-protein ligase A